MHETTCRCHKYNQNRIIKRQLFTVNVYAKYSSGCKFTGFVEHSSAIGTVVDFEIIPICSTQCTLFPINGLQLFVMHSSIPYSVYNYQNSNADRGCTERSSRNFLLIMMLLLPLDNSEIIKPDSKVVPIEAAFCRDSVGVKRGVFTTWTDSSGCHCSCNPVGNLAVSVCDENCDDPSQKDTLRSETRPDSESNQETFLENIEEKNSTDNVCFYPMNGHTYYSDQVWMSAESSCEKCRCINGTTDCHNSVRHCGTKCLPGQTTISTGPCCEHDCIGDESARELKQLVHCEDSRNNRSYKNGDTVTMYHECVDQICHCLHGNWSCLDFCVSRPTLPCPLAEQIFWDKFCCPRCIGKRSCSTDVMVNSWSENESVNDDSKNFVSILNASGKQGRRPRPLLEGRRLRRQSKSSEHANTEMEMMQIEPGQELITSSGRCVCTDGRMRCSRLGDDRIWHETDCYYFEHGRGVYYSEGERWQSKDDACIECKCLRGNTYTCKRNPCRYLFICPPRKIAVAQPGECCPSRCEDAKSKSRSMQLRKNRTWEKEFIPKEDDYQVTESTEIKTGKLSGCESLGPRALNSKANVLLVTETVVIIKRFCIDLKCTCTTMGKWVCEDYCNPCNRSISSELKDTDDAETKLLTLDRGGCCPSCDGIEDPIVTQSGQHNSLESYAKSITIFLVVVALIPTTTILLCCAYFRIKSRLEKRKCARSEDEQSMKEKNLPATSDFQQKRFLRRKYPLKLLTKCFKGANSSCLHSGVKKVQSGNQLIMYEQNNDFIVAERADVQLNDTFVNFFKKASPETVETKSYNMDEKHLPTKVHSYSNLNCTESTEMLHSRGKEQPRSSTNSDHQRRVPQFPSTMNERFGTIKHHFFVHLPPARQRALNNQSNRSTSETPSQLTPVESNDFSFSTSHSQPPSKPPFPKQLLDARTSF